MAKNVLTGGEFLVRETGAAGIFIPEEFNEEQQMIAQTCREFLNREVFPRLEDIDRQEEGLMEELLKKA
ncbi:MAG TPA: acyl-CoA dehydrogenase family protein, partial [Anseongella sp.]